MYRVLPLAWRTLLRAMKHASPADLCDLQDLRSLYKRSAGVEELTR